MHEDSDDDLLDAYAAAYRAANGSTPTLRHEGGWFYLLIRTTGTERRYSRKEIAELTEMLRARTEDAAAVQLK